MNSEPVGSNFPSSKNDILENVNSIISDGIEKVQCTLRQQNELYSRLNSDLKNTLLSNGSNIHSNSNPCSHVSEIINALNENFDNQNVHILDLPDHYKFNGDPARLVRFLQHITNKVLVRLHNPYVQWESITRNLVGSVRELAEKFYLHDMNIKEATFRFLNHLIDSYGNRFTIAYALISYFLDFKVEHSRNKIELLEYSAKLKIFICQMSYIGCSNFIDNPVFLNQALDNVPVFIRDRWSKFSVENDIFTGKIFHCDENFNLSYNTAKNKHPKYQDDTPDVPTFIPCPSKSEEHQISFTFATYERWFTSNYLPFYGSSLGKTDCEHEARDFLQLKNNISYSSDNVKTSFSFGANLEPKSLNAVSAAKSTGRKFFEVKSGIDFSKLVPSQAFRSNTVPLQLDPVAKSWSAEAKHLYLKKHKLCLKCGFRNCTSGDCLNFDKVEGFPCRLCSSKSTSHYHNESFHVHDVVSFREKYFTRVPTKKVSQIHSNQIFCNTAKLSTVPPLPISTSRPMVLSRPKYPFRSFVRVLISDSNRSNAIETICLLDSGSDASIVDFRVTQHLNISGKNTSIRLGGINSSHTRKVSICNLVVCNKLKLVL